METLDTLLAIEPFLVTLGIKVVKATSSAVTLALPYRPELSNHIQTLHAGAQFALGEATAVSVIALVFADHLETTNILTAQSSITYRRPAQGDLIATVSLTPEAGASSRTEWMESGRTRVQLEVEIQDSTGTQVTTMTVTCVVLRRV